MKHHMFYIIFLKFTNPGNNLFFIFISKNLLIYKKGKSMS